MQPGKIIEALEGEPARLEDLDGLPESAGFYAWSVRPDAGTA